MAASALVPGVSFWAHRDLVVQLARRELVRRYRGNALGPAWPILNPLLLFLTYAFVFAVIFDAGQGVDPHWSSRGPARHWQFALTLFAGVLPFVLFAEFVAHASTIVVREPALVKKVLVPLDILPFVLLLAFLPELAAGFFLLEAGVLLSTGTVPWTLVLLPLALLPLLLLLLGLGWLLAALGTYFRDTSNIVQAVTRILFFFTPVAYSLSIVPQPYRGWMALNPLASILNGIRRVAVWGEPPIWLSWALVTGASALLAAGGLLFFRRLRPGFADVV